MSLLLPAPIWRRLAASIYDGLLLIPVWGIPAAIDLAIRTQMGWPSSPRSFQTLLFLFGLGFFGWFWTHGGQTLGMRAWQIRVRRLDGLPVRWPVALIRYSVMLLTWFAVLLPATLLPAMANHLHAGSLAVAAGAYSVVALLVMILDGRHRAPCDLAAQTEVVVDLIKNREIESG